MTDYIDPQFIRSICKNPDRRNLQDLQVIYYGLHALEALLPCRDSVLRELCKNVRYERHEANDVLYYTGELSTCWYILLSGSVFIDGSMFLPTSSFGKRTGGSARRPNECFVLEPSEMIVIDYPEIQNSRSSYNSIFRAKPIMMDRGISLMFEDSLQGIRSEHLLEGRNRNSQSSDTSSAYSGSDTMASVHSVETEEVDLSGLVESIVDSDEDDGIESGQNLAVRDTVRECLEKDPSDRTEDDIEVLLEFTQHLKAFTNMTLSVRRALCTVMVFAVVEKAGTIVMNDGEELDSWSVLINGHVHVEHSDGTIEQLHLGDSFGILPTMEKLYHEGVMRTKCDDCQFVCITQTDYYRIQHQGEENIRRHQDANGMTVMVTEQRGPLEAGRRGYIVIRGTAEQLILQLVEENSMIDPTYVEDFLLTYRTFIENPLQISNQLMHWFTNHETRDRVTRVILLWVNHHFTDFEMDSVMMEFLENFEQCLEDENMINQLRLLNIACAAKARTRCITLARPSREEPLRFQLVGGYERGCGIYIASVEEGSKAEEVGLKRGDQMLQVNGHSFEHISYARALETLRNSTHLSITVKTNLTALKEVLKIPENAAVYRSSRTKPLTEIARLQSDPRARAHAINSLSVNSTPVKSCSKSASSSGGFMTLASKKKLQKALMKMNLLPKNSVARDVVDDSSLSHRNSEQRESSLYHHSHSQPDLVSMSYEDTQLDVPEHVLKVYKPDQSCKYLLVHKETTAHEVVMLALQEFGITEPSSNFSLCEVSVTEEGIIKQKRLPDQLQNLAEKIQLNGRYYLKTNGVTETLVSDELAPEIARESAVSFMQLNAIEVAVQLTLQDFETFRQIECTEYIDDLFQIKSKYGTPALSKFSELVNKEMFWVVTEICSEHNLVKRSKIIKQFIKVARQCKECKNFNSMFAIISGLGHGSISRLRQSWEKLPTKYQKLFNDLQQLMDPSRNMSKYRQLIASEQSNPPVIPFYPVVKKDLTFINLGNDTIVDGLVNFEKLRMISKEIRSLTNMCSSNYDLLSMLEQGGGHVSSGAMVTLNQMNSTVTNSLQGISTVKRRKKSSGALNPKKMFEEAQMVRRVKAYLSRVKVITDEDKLHEFSLLCESSISGQTPGSGQMRKRHPSPTLSTTSSTSSTSEGRKAAAPKFGSASPQAVRKLLSLSEQSKTRPHQPRHPSPSPRAPRRLPAVPPVRPPAALPTSHERSHSDSTSSHSHYHPLPLISVDLSAESSSVTSLSNLPLRKTITSGSVTSSDSGHSTQLDAHSNSSVETTIGCNTSSPPLPPHHRRHSFMQFPAGSGGAGSTNPRLKLPPGYNVAAQVAARMHKLGRAHSHEAVAGVYYHPTDQEDDEDAQVSAV